jgi:HTH-type transcriptional regulator, cell division transcriptional repressor
MATTGDRIRGVRDALGMTQDELAKTAGISKGFLSDVENNNRNISSEYLLRIANALGASIDYLLRGETKELSRAEPVVIPPELSQVAEELKLSYPQTLELLDAHRSIVARRSTRRMKRFAPEDWKELHRAIKRVFG